MRDRFALVVLCVASHLSGQGPLLVAETRQLASPAMEAEANFGKAIAVSSDILAIGEPNAEVLSHENAGAVHVYLRSGNGWAFLATLYSPDPDLHDNFGTSLAIDGATMLVGSPSDDSTPGVSSNQGAVHVFGRTGNSWVFQQKLVAQVQGPGFQFGSSVAVSGDRACVGSWWSSPGGVSKAGSAYVFERAGGVWSQVAELISTNPHADDNFGNSVAIQGDSAIVGSPGDDGTPLGNQGAVYVFGNSGGSWILRQRLTASSPGLSDWFGYSVGLHGSTLAIAAPGADVGGAIDAGAMCVFGLGSIWVEQSFLVASDGAVGAALGRAVAITNDWLVAGAAGDGHPAIGGAGAAYVWRKESAGWSERGKLQASDRRPGDSLGFSVAAAEGMVACGAPLLDQAPGLNAGAAYLFDVVDSQVAGIGTGCVGPVGLPLLSDSAYSGLNLVTLRLDNVPGSGFPPVLFMGAPLTPPVPLLALGVGAPGCLAYTSPWASAYMGISSAGWTIAIPVSAPGGPIRFQAVLLAPGWNAAELISSNAVDVVLARPF